MEALIFVFCSLAATVIALAGSKQIVNLWDAWRKRHRKEKRKKRRNFVI